MAPPVAAYLNKLLFDELARGSSAHLRRATILAILTAAAASLVLIMSYLSGYASAVVQQKTGAYAEDDLYQRVNSIVGLRPFEDPVFHNRLLLAERAVQQAPSDVTSFFVLAVQRALSLTGYLSVLISLWPPMGILLVLTALPAALSHRSLARQQIATVAASADVRRRHEYYSRLSTESRSAKEIRVYGLAGLFQRRLVTAMNTANAADTRQMWRTTKVEIMFALVNASVVAIATVVAVRGLLQGTLTLGGVVFFLAGVATVQAAFSGIITQLGSTMASLRLFENYLDVADVGEVGASAVRPDPLPLAHSIEFKDVWFRYDAHSPWVLQGLDLVIPAGSTLGLVGPNGAGKSTLIKLLLRFYEPERGVIVWDTIPLAELDPIALRRRVGVVFQDFVAYELSAGENIGLGDVEQRKNVDRIREAAQLAEVDEALSSLRRGYDTMLGCSWLDEDDERGGNLSGGQWQRLALARAFMRTKADLVILDEPSASLDPEAEHHVNLLLQRFRGVRTGLLVSHRLNALRSADSIAVLEAGRVAELGTHDALMQLGGRYAQLFSLQASGYQDERVVTTPS